MTVVIPVIGLDFECSVCFNTELKSPTKYKCTSCTKQTCDDCYIRHIITKKDCVFCRSPLILIDEVDKSPIILTLCERYTKIICPIVCIFMIWYFLLFMYMFVNNFNIRTYELMYNITN